MCGISLVVGIGDDAGAIDGALTRAHGALAHRGPDGEAFLWIGRDGTARRSTRWIGGAPDLAAGIAFHQLKVQDLSEAAVQPLASSDGATWIVLNGEIYNAGELRSVLCNHGHRFQTRSDAEVAMAAYREWGPGCVERFRGMWAFFILDVARRTLFGSRDRLGIKPMYYSIEPSRLVFASEPRAVMRARGAHPSANRDRIREFLTGLPPESARDTFFDGVRLMPEASVVEIDLQNRGMPPAFRRFWDLRDYVSTPGDQPPFDRAVTEVRSHLESSISEHAQAAVPVGCLLSGGLDTSYVARSLAKRAQGRGDAPVPSYSIVFSERDMSELPFIWSVVRGGGLNSHMHQLTPAQAWRDVDAVVATQGQPLLGQDLIAQYHAYQLARQHGSVVVLEGQGADELLAGMPSYAAARFDELLAGWRPRELVTELWTNARRRGASRSHAAARLARWFARKAVGPRPPSLPEWVEAGSFGHAGDPPNDWTPSRDPSRLNQSLFRLVSRTNLPTVLQYQDRSAMAHGIESRVPFLDHRFVEYCFRLPPDYKVYRGRYKRVLAAAAAGLVPDAVLARRDKKTFVSKTNWIPLREEHATVLREMASSATMQNTHWFKPQRLARFVEDYLQGRHDDGPALWRLYTAWRWLELFEVRS